MRFVITTLLLAVHLCCSAQLWHCNANSFRPQLEGIPIRQILHDSEGFVWYATENSGLIRDDGYSLVHFYPKSNDEIVLNNALIACLAEDDKHNIWIGTDKGLFVLDKKDYSITLVEQTINLAVTDVLRRANGDMVAALVDRLLVFSSGRELKNTFALPRDNNDSWVTSMTEDNFSQIVVVMVNGGIFILDEPSGLLVNMNWPYSFTPYHVVADHQSQSLWISSWGMGVVRYTTDFVRMFTNSEDEPVVDSENNKVVDVAIDNSHRLFWIVASDSLSVYRADSTSWDPINMPETLPRKMYDISCASLDAKNNLWIATLQNGLFVLDIDEFIGGNASKGRKDSIKDLKPRVTMITVDSDTILTLDDESIDVGENVKSVCVYLSLLDMLNAQNVRFSYRLSSSDEWKELPKGKNKIEMLNLPDETVSLYVRFALSKGKWSDEIECLTIKNGGFASGKGGWFFYVILLALVLGGAGWYYRKRGKFVASQKAVPAKPAESANNSEKTVEAVKEQKPRIQRIKSTPNTSKTVITVPPVEHSKPKKETTRKSAFSKKEDKEFADKIERFIKNHISNVDYGVEELAADVNLSRMQLYRRTQALYGLTPLELMRDRRMERAAHLLTTTNLIVADIAALTGFSTVRGFNRSFKLQFNLSPSEFRNRFLSDSPLNGRE